ncbi:MAG: hypothetical protein GXO60_09790, partial [Epsilonproteobacteria bacterium]|nr:hypothetical protein [Campylobacterota bacterium]
MKRNAFSLALTLWIVAIMSLASVFYLSYAKKIVMKTKELNLKLKLIFQAESIVELIKFYGATGNIEGDRIVNTLLSQSIKDFPKQLFIDSRKNSYQNTIIILQDSAGLINIGDTDALVNYISNQSEELKDKKDIIRNSIIDWLDINNFSMINGAEDSFYKRYSYKARSYGYFSNVGELFLLRGLIDLNITTKDKILNSLVKSPTNIRNILSMRFDLLHSIYNISQSDLL